MLERIKAFFGRKKDKKKKAERIARKPEFEIPDMPEMEEKVIMRAGVGFDSPDNDIVVRVPKTSPGPRGHERSYPVEQPASPAYVPTPSPAWEPPASPVRSYDDTPSYSRSSCSSSSSSYDSGSSHSSSYSSCSSDSGSSSSDSGSCGGGGGCD